MLQLTSAILLLLVLAAGLYLSHRTSIGWDLSDQGRNSLTPTQSRLLTALEGPITITAFTRDLPVQRTRMRELVTRMQRVKNDVTLDFVDPIAYPDQARAAGIQQPGQLRLTYAGRTESALRPRLEDILSALERLGRTGAQWIVELERPDSLLLTPDGVSGLGEALEQRGYRIVPLSLLHNTAAPDNTALLLLTGGDALENIEADRLLTYLEDGGNLLWLSETLSPMNLSERLGISALPGTIVDAAAAELSLERPDFAVTRPMAGHPLGPGFEQPVVLPQARALRHRPVGNWRPTGGLETGARSWNETGSLSGTIQRDPLLGELSGPLTPALLLERPRPSGGMQRVAVIGDVDLLADSHLGRGANLPFGLALIRWLTENEHLGSAGVDIDPGSVFEWPPQASAWIGLGLLGGLPMVLLLTGATIRWRRQRR